MMAAAALLFVPCTALRRIYEYIIHTYLIFFSEASRGLTHLPELPCLHDLNRYATVITSAKKTASSKQHHRSFGYLHVK